MRTDAVEVPSSLADTGKTVKYIPLKATIKFGSIVKYESLLMNFALCNNFWHNHFTPCQTSLLFKLFPFMCMASVLTSCVVYSF